jgi:hypothetical protein
VSRDWERKRPWHVAEGDVEGKALFTTSEAGGLQSKDVADTVESIRRAVEDE